MPSNRMKVKTLLSIGTMVAILFNVTGCFLILPSQGGPLSDTLPIYRARQEYMEAYRNYHEKKTYEIKEKLEITREKLESEARLREITIDYSDLERLAIKPKPPPENVDEDEDEC